MPLPFWNIYRHGFVRVAVAVPHVRVANPKFNTERTLAMAQRAVEAGAALVLFPELGISAYSCEDLFAQDALLDAVEEQIAVLCEQTRELDAVLLVGAPVRVQNRLFNGAFALHKGQILGIVPKSYLPNYREFYEKRQFADASSVQTPHIHFAGQRHIPFGTDLIFAATGHDDFQIGVEICEDVWTPLAPSTFAALAGATVLCNLSASNITIGKADYRKNLCANQSAKTVSAYMYSAAGPGESTTDLAWDGHALIYENGDMLTESVRFSDDEDLILADVDLERLVQERARLSSFTDTVARWKGSLNFRRIHFDWAPPQDELKLEHRNVERFPFVPNDPKLRDERCFEAYNIQVYGLMKRLQSIQGEKVVIGVSGGLDSTHALIVAAKTMDKLGLPRRNILGFTMPGFATSDKTLENAWALMNALGIEGREIDIKPSCLQMLRDLGHPFAEGKPQYDITFENVQAGERTSHLFRLANFHNAIVLGTGDLSELALGWCTYGVGDHMSHYNVNGSVPKTLIQHLIRYVIETAQFDAEASRILGSILDTEISPELVPSDSGSKDAPTQSTQAKIGPYELQDFNLYYLTRFGFRPSKIAFLSHSAWSDVKRGAWPSGFGEAKKNEYTIGEIKKWLDIFCFRFFQISQFKRSCVPNGPKVGSGGSLSPRGDWRAPSDGESAPWLDELRANVPDA
ncbi:glutamine-dependent NAD(+) synthetase [Abditibacteriota bacterium]|nr:glutamine-dependent NAD(+) synthetase [Abditibacteriota bacterium]